jgi:ABC-type lipoprotein release transport system permease subunit
VVADLRLADIGFDRHHLVAFAPVFPDEVAPETTTFVLATVALGITACIAALIPARRAATIDPGSATRLE